MQAQENSYLSHLKTLFEGFHFKTTLLFFVGFGVRIFLKYKNIYLTYSNGVFELREYEFANFLGYNSIQLVKSERYSIYSYEINIESIQNIMNTTKVGAEPQTVPFPQADAFERVVNLCELLNANEFILKVDITENYGFDSRQTDCYLNACCYLGLADSNKNDQGDSVGVLTEKGRTIFSKDINERRMLLIEAILAKNAFRETLKLYFSKAEMPNREEIVRIMRNSNLYRVGSDSTYERRASTISGWINWVVNQLEE